MSEIKHIIEKVGPLFRKYGIKSITMDDVARELGMSKKTLYQIISDKNELIRLVIDSDLRTFRQQLNALNSEDIDAILHMIKIQKHISSFLSEMSLPTNYDLRKYYSDIYEEVRNEFLDLFEQTFLLNLKNGKEQGWYRDDINESVIVKFHLNFLDQVPNSALISKKEYSSDEYSKEIGMYHLYAIVNDNGRKKMLKYIDQIEKINKPEAI